MLNYYNAAKVLEELMLGLIEKKAAIPAHVTEDLKAGRSLANILRRKADDADIAAKTGLALESVEMNLLSLAEANLGADCAEAWQTKIIAAYNEDIAQDVPAPAPKMASAGVPKSDYWIRVKTSELADFRERSPDKPPEVYSLSAVEHEDGYTLIHGGKENVIAYLKEICEILRKVEEK